MWDLIPELCRLLHRELALPLQGLLLGQQLCPLSRQSLLLLQHSLEHAHLGALFLKALSQLLLQCLLLTCDLGGMGMGLQRAWRW